jgi:RES domain-containing protein
LKVEVPDGLAVQHVREADLPAGWKKDLIVTRTVGDEWLAAQATALLRVPSVIVPETYNFLLNPKHPDAARLKVISHHEYPWDERLFS